MLTRLLLLVLTTFCLQNIYAEPPVAKCHSKTTLPVFQDTDYKLQAWQLDNDSYSKQFLDLTFAFSADVNDTEMTLSCADAGFVDVTLYVHDSNGEYDSCVTQLEVQSICSETQDIVGTTDTIAPYLFLQTDFEPFNLDSVSFGQLPARDFNLGSYDNVTGKRDIEYSYSKDFDVDFFYHHCDDPENQDVTIYARDEAGNVSWATIRIINAEINCDGEAHDVNAPEAICRDSIILPIDATTKSARLEASALNKNSSDDITPAVKLEFSFSETDKSQKSRTFNCADLGETLVTLYVYDHEGNVGSCQTKVILTDMNDVCDGVDASPPSAKCQGNVTIELNSDIGEDVLASTFNDGSTDDVTTEENLRYSYSNDINDTTKVFGCDNVGDNTITLYVWDEEGKSSTCTSTLTITDPNEFCADIIDPVAQCSSDASYEVLSKTETYDIVASDLNNGSSDNKTANADLRYSFSENVDDTIAQYNCSDVGDLDLTLYVTDEAGNFASCDVTVSITDPNDVCTSSTDYTYQNTIKVFPNPFTSVITMKNLPISEGKLTISVQNLLGQTLLSTVSSSVDSEINLDVQKGIYLIQVMDEQGKTLMIKKLIKQ